MMRQGVDPVGECVRKPYLEALAAVSIRALVDALNEMSVDD